MNAEELRAEPGADAGMALAARLRQVLGIDRGARIGGGQNVVHAVAGRAVGRSDVAALQEILHQTLRIYSQVWVCKRRVLHNWT